MTRYRIRPPYPTVPDGTAPDAAAVELTQEQAQAFADALADMNPGDPQPDGLERPYSISIIGTPYLPNGRFVDPATIERVGGIASSRVARPYTPTGKPRGGGSHRPPVDPDPSDDATWNLLLAARQAAIGQSDLTAAGVASAYAGRPATSARGVTRALGGKAGLRRFLENATRPG